jgi:hypothetical protein
MSCAQCDGFYGLGGCSGSIINHCERGCDYWTNLCLEYPGVSCDIAAGRCCGSTVCYGLHNPSWKVRVSVILSCEFRCSIKVKVYLTTSFELSLPLFDCLYKSHVLTEVTIISLHLHKP